MLEKLSLPAESAGTGAFLMAGYCVRQSGSLVMAQVRWLPTAYAMSKLPKELQSTYRCCPHTAVLSWGSTGGCGSLDELKVLRRLGVDICRHDWDELAARWR